MNHDTICALATANGTGALGIIRVSGQDSFKIVNKVFEGKNLEKASSHTVHYGYIVDKKPENQDAATGNSDIIDEVMISVFRAPKTFTTEDSAEISFHGSPHIAQKILEVLIKNGARMAKAGEFTMRAFMNGRIDLSQAEAIADVIASENEASRKLALNQLKGGISHEISELRGDLLNFTSLVELELDFAEEDVEFADRTALTILLNRIQEKLSSLIDSFQYGNAVKNGVDVAIIGKPNAGKSTLLNALLKEERAIVSDIAGTTRDTIEEIIHIKGNAFRLIDTAGIRETSDEIEKIGVEKAKERAEKASVLIYLIDAASPDLSEDIMLLKEILRKDFKTIICFTKSAKIKNFSAGNLKEKLLEAVDFGMYGLPSFIEISALEQQNLDVLKKELSQYVDELKTEENTVITNQRHYESLQKSLESVKRVKAAISQSFHTELLAYELRYALEYLGEISGEFTNDEVLGNIFSKFCIGK